MRRQVREIALREIRTRARSRGFRAITGLMLVLAIAAPIVMSLIPDTSDELRRATIGVALDDREQLEAVLDSLATDSYELSFVDLTVDPPPDVEQLLTRGDIDVAVEPPAQLVWADSEDSSLSNLITVGLGRVAALERADRLGLDIEDLAEVFTPIEVSQRSVRRSDTTEGIRQGVALFGLFLTFLLPQIFGQLTMLSVVEEKSTRVVEVLLSHIRPQTLLIGKILGLCSLAVVQLMLIVVGLIGSLLVTDLVDVPAAVWRFVPMMTVSVLGGLAIYTTLFALLGSLISRQEDAAQVMLPVFAPLMIGYFVGQAAVFGDAESIWVRALTWFPLTSPMLLPVRVARGAIGPAEAALSLGLLVIAAFALIKLASRVYEFTLLRTGSRVGWGELIRLSRGSIVD